MMLTLLEAQFMDSITTGITESQRCRGSFVHSLVTDRAIVFLTQCRPTKTVWLCRLRLYMPIGPQMPFLMIMEIFARRKGRRCVIQTCMRAVLNISSSLCSPCLPLFRSQERIIKTGIHKPITIHKHNWHDLTLNCLRNQTYAQSLMLIAWPVQLTFLLCRSAHSLS